MTTPLLCEAPPKSINIPLLLIMTSRGGAVTTEFAQLNERERMDKEKVSTMAFLLILFASITVNSSSLALTFTGLLTKPFSFTYLLAIIISTIQYLLAIGILLYIYLSIYDSHRSIKTIGTQLARMELLSVFMLCFTLVFHALELSDWIDTDPSIYPPLDTRNLNIRMTLIPAVLTVLTIFLVFLSFCAYSCHRVLVSNSRTIIHQNDQNDDIGNGSPSINNSDPVDQSLKQVLGDKSTTT